MKTTFTILFFLFTAALQAQTISGKVTDVKKQPVVGANVYIKGSYDGTSTDTTGSFSFSTSETDTVLLVVSYMGYETIETRFRLKPTNTFSFTMKESQSAELKEVVITAGTFEASDNQRMTILKPMDIVNTAGASADIFKAMQVLPGTTQVGEQEGLFVRGGSASETKAIIDGLIVQNPFFSSVPNVAQRGRFQPFQFKGMAFSTGGYSSQYGQALSSVMVMNSADMPTKSSYNVGINFAAIYGGMVKRWKNTSISNNATYFDTQPILFNLIKQNLNWQTAPYGFTDALNILHKTSQTGIIKAYVNYSFNKMGFTGPDALNSNGQTYFNLRNNNLYSNISYNESFGKNTLNVGFSQSYNRDNLTLDTAQAIRGDSRTQGKVTLSHFYNDNITFHVGTELHYYDYQYDYSIYKNSINNVYSGTFAEADIYFTRKLVGRLGVRNEYSRVINRWNVAPRMSLAYKTGDYSQVSFATGIFYQDPSEKYLYLNKNLDFERADHYILNYQHIKDGRTFRVELYRKNYKDLVREIIAGPFDANQYRFPVGATENSGYGYAQGLDVFFRDKKTFKNAEYWISYSYLDTKRLYANYLTEVMPTFAADHTVNLLYKQTILPLSTQINTTYTFSTGRPYYNPNNADFLADRTPAYHNLSISANYYRYIKGHLLVFYAEVSNVLGTQNVFGYRYSADGSQRISTNPPAYRSFFIGTFINFNRKAG